MSDNEIIAQLVEEALKDDSKFDELYGAIVNKVYFWCYNTVNNSDTARDLTQDVMVRIARSLHTLDNPENFVVWAYVISKNVCKNFYHKNKNAYNTVGETEDDYEEMLTNIEDTSILYHPEKSFDEMTRNELVVNFVDNLPRRQKEVITLFYLEELSVDEISTALDITESSVKSNLHFGRNNIEKQVTDYQTNTGVRLYDGSILLVLGAILGYWRNVIVKNVDFTFCKLAFMDAVSNLDQPNVKSTNHVETNEVTKRSSWISTNIGTVLLIGTLLGAAIVGAAVYSTNEKSIDVVEEIQVRGSLIKDITIFETDSKTNSPVVINLWSLVNTSDITILHGDKEVSFKYKNQKITLDTTENGHYELMVKNETANFQIRSINKPKPVILGYKQYGKYIQLDVDDSLSTMDYERSYVTCNGIQYKIDEHKRIYGVFKGEIQVFIYSVNDQLVTEIFRIE